jgi:hypothetical protein
MSFVTTSDQVEPLVAMSSDDNDGNGVWSPRDQHRIVADAHRLGLTHVVDAKYHESLFWHVENVRVAFREANVDVPEWFAKKYGNRERSVAHCVGQSPTTKKQEGEGFGCAIM